MLGVPSINVAVVVVGCAAPGGWYLGVVLDVVLTVVLDVVLDVVVH